jgi:hypothetical protein
MDSMPVSPQTGFPQTSLVRSPHWIRDVTFREDAHQARTRNGPAVAAVLRNTAIGWHHTNGETNIARATRRADRHPNDLVTAVTSSKPTTQ